MEYITKFVSALSPSGRFNETISRKVKSKMRSNIPHHFSFYARNAMRLFQQMKVISNINRIIN